jgi:PIN domain nuclease of toxin-antitoxin system
MILLLDAHALVWMLDGDVSLSRPARASITDPANDVLVSAATVWELVIKRAAGKIRLPSGLAQAVEELGYVGLPVTIDHAEAAAALPAHHKDPFDRMLIAQAQWLDAVIVTRDRAFGAYDVRILTA